MADEVENENKEEYVDVDYSDENSDEYENYEGMEDPDSFTPIIGKDLDDFREAGRIAAKVREESKRLIMIGEPILDIAETIEQMILDEGAKLGFPTNISINEIAAHYSPSIDCKRVIGDNDVVKVDLGTNVNGAIGDTAYTIDVSGKYSKLVEASEKALENAMEGHIIQYGEATATYKR